MFELIMPTHSIHNLYELINSSLKIRLKVHGENKRNNKKATGSFPMNFYKHYEMDVNMRRLL